MPELRHYLKEWRIKREMTQEQLASALNTTKGAISRYERGEYGLNLLVAGSLMRALNITAWQFFHPPDEPSADALLAELPPEERARYVAALEVLIRPQKPV